MRDFRPPFCYQTIAALDVVREAFTGQHRPLAIAIYTTLTEVANEVGGADARESFEAARKRIAEMAGVTLQTLDRYVKRMEEFGLIEVERRQVGGANLPNVWSLRDIPPGSADHATPGSADHALRARPGLSEERTPKKDPSGGGAIVAHFVDATKALGGDVPSRVKGQVARLVGELLKEGIAPAHVTAGVDLLVERRLHPSTLPSCVNEASMPRRAPARGRSDGRMTAEEIMARAIQHREEGR